MGKKLSSFDFEDGARPEYPWSDWESGIWHIFQGEDFTVTLKSMQSQIYLRAHSQGRPVRTRLQADPPSIIFEFGAVDAELLRKAQERAAQRAGSESTDEAAE